LFAGHGENNNDKVLSEVKDEAIFRIYDCNDFE
jgi:hypothetical protein